MPKLRKKYSAEEKVRIVLASLSGQWTQAQISSKYGVHATQISNWKREFRSGAADIFRDKCRKEGLEKDALIEALYKEIGREKVELDWLKKNLGNSLSVKSECQIKSGLIQSHATHNMPVD